MFKIIIRSSLAFILLFALASCNESSEMTKTSEGEAAQSVLEVNSPLGQFLASSSKPAVVKFYAEWCSTCKQYSPSFEKVKAEMSEAVDFYEVDVDDSNYKALLKQLKISRIPETVFINKDRTNVTKKLGAIPRVKLEKLINTQLI